MRVTVVGSVCPLINISPLECLFVLKTISRTQQATKVKIIVWISQKLLRCRDTPLPALYSRPFWKPHTCHISISIACAFSKIHTHMVPRVLHFRAFINFPFLCGNIPVQPAYGVYISQLVRIGRISDSYNDFCSRTSKLICQGFR